MAGAEPEWETTVEAEGARLAAHVARPPGLGRVPGLVLCHGFPSTPGGAATVGNTFPRLADWLAKEAGWAVLTFHFRGTGASSGDFSVKGWLDDIEAARAALEARDDVAGVWLAGFTTGGTLSVCYAARDEGVRGVAIMGAPASLRTWVSNVPRFLEHARLVGVLRTPGFPPDPVAWAREIAELDPLAAAAKIPPRPLLVLHGADDDVVSPADAEAYAQAGGPEAELRIVPAAGHRLRHDPRVVAMLLGWLARQVP